MVTSTPDQVHQEGMNIELNESEMLQQDWGEEAEIDDSVNQRRDVRMIQTTVETKGDRGLAEKARQRRKWEVISLRTKNKRTGAM